MHTSTDIACCRYISYLCSECYFNFGENLWKIHGVHSIYKLIFKID